MGLAALVDLRIAIDKGTVRCWLIWIHRTTTDRTNLATAIETAANDTAVHIDTSGINVAVCHISATKHVTTSVEQVIARFGIVEFLDILIIVSGSRASHILIAVTDATVVDGHVGRTEDTTALTTAIDIAVDSGNTVGETGAVEVADDNVRLAENIAGIVIVSHIANQTIVITHTASPAATEDVTRHTALDVGIGTGLIIVLVCYVKEIVDTTGRTSRIDIFIDRTAKQSDIGRTIDIATQSIRCTTIATAIGIAPYSGTLFDNDVGIVSLIGPCLLISSQTAKVAIIHLGRSYQIMWIGKVHI